MQATGEIAWKTRAKFERRAKPKACAGPHKQALVDTMIRSNCWPFTVRKPDATTLTFAARALD